MTSKNENKTKIEDITTFQDISREFVRRLIDIMTRPDPKDAKEAEILLRDQETLFGSRNQLITGLKGLSELLLHLDDLAAAPDGKAAPQETPPLFSPEDAALVEAFVSRMKPTEASA